MKRIQFFVVVDVVVVSQVQKYKVMKEDIMSFYAKFNMSFDDTHPQTRRKSLLQYSKNESNGTNWFCFIWRYAGIFKNGRISASFCIFSSFYITQLKYKFIKVLMHGVVDGMLGTQTWVAGWKAYTNSPRYGGTTYVSTIFLKNGPIPASFCFIFVLFSL